MCQSWINFLWLISLLIMSHIVLLLCMPGNFRLDARHCEFCLVWCWYFCIPLTFLSFVLECVYIALKQLDPFVYCY